MKSDDRKILHPRGAWRSAKGVEAETSSSALQFMEKHTSLYHFLLYKTGHQANQHVDNYIHAIVQNSEENE